jgi:hypothetical protein
MVIKAMLRIETEDFLEVKKRMQVNGSKAYVAYAQVTKVEDEHVELGLYNHKRLLVGEKVLDESEIRDSESFKQTDKEPRQISWEFRKNIEK